MSSRKEKIVLIVEAGQTALSTRKLILETAGYNVISAVRAEQALRFAEAYDFDFIIFDVDVRDLDPAETVGKLRRRLPHAPFYLLAPGPWPPEHLKGGRRGIRQNGRSAEDDRVHQPPFRGARPPRTCGVAGISRKIEFS